MRTLVSVLPPLAVACCLTLLAGCGPSKTELAREIAALKEQLEKDQSQGRSLSGQLATAKTELEAALKQLAETRAQAQVLGDRVGEAKISLESEQKALTETRSELERTRLIVIERDRQISEREAETKSLAQQLDQSRVAERSAASEREAETKSLAQQLDQSRVAERSAASERDALAAEVSALRQRIAASETQLQQSGSSLEQEQRRASDLTDRLAAVIKEQSSLKQTSESQRQELASIAAALADAQAKVARLTGARGIYTVQDGDSLSSIALYFYRNAYRWPGIAKANSHLINHPDRIFPAMVLIIPK